LREALDNFSSQNQTPRSSFKAGDRFLPPTSTKITTMHLKISLPTYGKDKWEYLEVRGHITVEGKADNLSEGYDQLKVQVEALLKQVNAENRLSLSVTELNRQISEKEEQLKTLAAKVERANGLYKTLIALLRSVGVDTNVSRLTFDSELLLQIVSTPAVVGEVVEYDPIPFKAEEVSTPHEF
jgi:hypothetical protein